MTLFAYLAGSDQAHRVRLGSMGLTSRADGSQGFGGIVFDDQDKSLDVRGWMHVVVQEDACTTAPYLYSGYIMPRRVSRSSSGTTYRDGVARFIDCDLVDENAVLDVRLITNTDGNRPAETHADRITWLLGSAYMTGLIDDTSLVDLSNPRPFEEASYVGQYASNVLEDINSALARTSFVYTLGATGGRGLFFDFPDQAVGICTLSISNDLSDITLDSNGDVTGTVYPPFIDATETIDPSWVYSKVRYRYRNGVVIEENPTTLSTFFTDNDLGDRGINVENSRIGVEATAREFANNYLLTHSVEPTTLNLAVIVPKEKAGLIRAGQFIDVKLTHIDGLETFQSRRITECQIAHADNTNEKYLIVLELANRPVGVSGPSGGAPPPDTFPHPPPAVGGIVQQVSGSGNIQMPSPITDGNTLVFAGTHRGASFETFLSDRGYTLTDGQVNDPGGTNTAVIGYKLASSESQYIGGSNVATNIGVETTGTWYEIAGEWTLDQHGKTQSVGTHVSTPAITAAANSLVFGVVGQGQGGAYDSVAGTLTYTTDPPMTEDFDTYSPAGGHPNNLNAHYAGGGSIALIAVNSGNVGLSGTDYNYVALIASFTSADLSATAPPSPGQWVRGETPSPAPDGSTTTFTTLFPFADGTLRVWVDLLDQTAAVTSYDGATGSFTLGFAPWGTDVLVVEYQGR